ncbi:MAG: glycosyltransferase family 4 protein [Nostoc sp. NMS2]|uniref:glycosyltransferase family 4 protein n=1 Tax=Nostoc sp. NMS2 TaxID=2815389 RepID=UPI0025F83B7A|nr:glycosyltransferase family 4 protein [Nostoc sp. NMS2]MBN3992897.1 glycosyltransferase family 4 protein [Nostoc sp. NMS2]
MLKNNGSQLFAKRRITLVIPSLYSGGAERVLSIISNYWARKGWKITLLTFFGDQPPFYHLDSRITYIPLHIAGDSFNLIAAVKNNLYRIYKLRLAITASNPDIVISFMSEANVTTLLATRGLNVPVLVSERINPEISLAKSSIWMKLRQWTYPLAERVIVQTQRALNYFPSSLQTRICAIPNPVLLPPPKSSKPKELSDKLPGQKFFIAVGRLEQQKGFDLLLQAFANLKDDFPQWQLIILGEGTLHLDLTELCHQLGLNNRVDFPGRVKNIYEFLQEADIYVMSSRFEGFPNALCEAMACGLPVISTDCPNGPREIIRDGIDGLLVPNEDVLALTAAMKLLMSDEEKRKHLATNASGITERLSIAKIMEMWEFVVKEVVE